MTPPAHGRRFWPSLVITIGLLGLAVSGRAAEATNVVVLWPDGAPDALGTNDVDRPTLTVFLPDKRHATGAGVIVCPGGAYTVLAIDHEGQQVAQRLNAMGVAGFVLQYRLGPRYHHPAPLQDAQRAIRYVRSHARELGLSPQRIGILGFSAGGHLASTAGTHFDAGHREAPDEIERESCRPDFMVLCYPVISLGTNGHSYSRKMLLGDNPDPKLIELLSNEKRVTASTPPAFIWHTSEDYGVSPDNSIAFYQAMQKARIPVEAHFFAFGPHGIGLASGDSTAISWPELLALWMRRSGFLTDAPRVQVAGRVTIDGKPVNRGWITFVPANSENAPMGSYYITKDGMFNIETKDGPCAGKHRIEVRQLASDFLAKPSIDCEKHYTATRPHGWKRMTCELRPGTNMVTVALTSK